MVAGVPGIEVSPVLPQGPAALIVAHPGHELRVWGWMSAARPTVHVLTDGSGRSGQSRLADSVHTFEETGCRPGSVLGRFTDAGIYQLILAGRFAVFRDLAEELAERLHEGGIRCVVGDSCEGYNPSHDACRFLIDGAVEILRACVGPIASYDFRLTGHPAAEPGSGDDRVEVRLGAEAFERKVAAARRCPDLAVELSEAVRLFGADAFRFEVLRPCADHGPSDGLADETPFYEEHGERKVASGKYGQAIRRREHMLPLAADLWRHARRRSPACAS
jgi:hypothetical protein